MRPTSEGVLEMDVEALLQETKELQQVTMRVLASEDRPDGQKVDPALQMPLFQAAMAANRAITGYQMAYMLGQTGPEGPSAELEKLKSALPTATIEDVERAAEALRKYWERMPEVFGRARAYHLIGTDIYEVAE